MDKKEAIKKVTQYKLLIRNYFDLDSVYLLVPILMAQTEMIVI